MTSNEPNVDRLTSAQTTAHELTRRYRSVAGSLRAWDMREEAIGRATEVAFNTFERLRTEAEMLSDEADRYRQVAEAEQANGQEEFDGSSESLPGESAHASYEETYDAWTDANKKAQDQEDQLVLLQHEATLIEVDHLFEAVETLYETRASAEEIRSLIAAELNSAADYSQSIGGPIVFDADYREPILLRSAATTLLNPADVAARKKWRSYAIQGVSESKRRGMEMTDFLARLDQRNVQIQAGDAADKASETYRTVASRLTAALQAAAGYTDAARLRDRTPVASSRWVEVQGLCNRLRLTMGSRVLDVAKALDAASGQDVEKELRAADWKSVLDSLEFMSTLARDRAADAAKRLRAAEAAAERRTSTAELFSLVAASEAAAADAEECLSQWNNSVSEGDNYREESAALIGKAHAIRQVALNAAAASLEDESIELISVETVKAELRRKLAAGAGLWPEAIRLQAAAVVSYLDAIMTYGVAYDVGEVKVKARRADAAAREALKQANLAASMSAELQEVRRQFEDAIEEAEEALERSETVLSEITGGDEEPRSRNRRQLLNELRSRMSELENDAHSAEILTMEHLAETANLARSLRHEALRRRYDEQRINGEQGAHLSGVEARAELAALGFEFRAEDHSEVDLAAIRARRYAEFAKANEMALTMRAVQLERRLAVVREMYQVSAARFVEMAATEANERGAEEVEFNKLRDGAENARLRLAELSSADTPDSSG